MKCIKNFVLALLSAVLVVFSSGCVSENTASDISSNISTSVSVQETSAEDKAQNKTASNSKTPAKITTAPVGTGKATPVNAAKLPSFSGQPYVTVNDNIPNFSSSELTTIGYEKYGNLDSLGRCTVAVASCGKEIMPETGEKRGSISSIKPTGWVQAKYDNISGKYLYNRCHLIGWQLSAENANRQNLITGTKYMNVSGMLPFENMVADYIKETDNHVAYRITPIFEGDNLLASGIQMEAYSVEDSGKGICFNVYCYNIQPDITINYADGSSSGKQAASPTEAFTTSIVSSTPEPVVTPPAVASPTAQEPAQSSPPTSAERVEQPADSPTVYRTPSVKRYHLISTCGGANSYAVTREQAVNAGLTPCQKCAQ